MTTEQDAGLATMTDRMSTPSVGNRQESAALQSVATILRNHLLSDISDENDALRKDNESLDAVRETLTMVKIQLGDTEISVDLADTIAMVEEDAFDADGTGDHIRVHATAVGRNVSERFLRVPFYKVPRGELAVKQMMVLFDSVTDWAVPLSDLNENLVLTRASLNVGKLRGVHFVAFLENDENLSTLISLTPEFALRGTIHGLGEDDLKRFKEEEFGSEKLLEYLETGTGLQAENAVFLPMALYFQPGPNIMDILDLLRGMCHEGYRGHSKPAVLPSEYELSRRKIITAIGSNDEQMKILEENEVLRVKNNSLCAMADILGTVKVYHSAGTLTLGLAEGGLLDVDFADEIPLWAIDCEGKESCEMVAGDMHYHHATLSGTCMYVRQVVRTHQGSNAFRIEYHNGVVMAMEGIADNSGELESDTPLKVVAMIFPFEMVKDTLGMLGLIDDSSDDEE